MHDLIPSEINMKQLPPAPDQVIRHVAEEANYVNLSDHQEVINEPRLGSVSNLLELPIRNWGTIIERHNQIASLKERFPLQAYQVKAIIHRCSMGHIPRVVLNVVGITKAKYVSWVEKADRLETLYEALTNKDSELTEEEKGQLLFAAWHPLRLFIGDLRRCEAMAQLKDVDSLNSAAKDDGHLQLKKMKQRWPEEWGEAADKASTTVNVQVVQVGNVDLSKL